MQNTDKIPPRIFEHQILFDLIFCAASEHYANFYRGNKISSFEGNL